jgi:ATP-dependent exoDNAse (exonuclease V) beta subunit
MKPMQNAPFVIYKSSAGSGKTYTLTKEYLQLALRHPTAFTSILAVTFTNKATQEMKERILLELKKLKNKVEADDSLHQSLLQYFNIEPKELQEKARNTLSAIIHQYSSFSVSTIDSFFQRVVRAFAREINLNAKFEVELDQDSVMEIVVERIIKKVVDDPYIHQKLVTYAIEQIQLGKSWDIRGNILSLAMQIFREDFKKYSAEISAFLKDRDALDQFSQDIEEKRKKLLADALSIKQEANNIRLKHHLEWSDFSRSFPAKFDLLGAKPPKKIIPTITPLQKLLSESPENWATKTSKLKNQIETAFYDGLGRLWGLIPDLEVEMETLLAIRQNMHVFGIFKYILDELRDIKDEENMLLISDANEFLTEITKENEAPFIYEKVGNQFSHFLIDEFQDTSGFQWSSFKPLLENSLAQGHLNLLVGDVKQSIYRWRGGEMKLLLEQVEQETGHFGVAIENLDTNHRSLKNVVEFNNTVFSLVPKEMEKVLESKDVTPSGMIVKAYEGVKQNVSFKKSKSEFSGKVKIEFLESVPSEEEEELKVNDLALQKIPEMVMFLQDQGYELKDIAFLVRSNYEGEKIADTLLEYEIMHPDSGYQFDILSDDSMFLTKAKAVKVLLAALKSLNQPHDQVQFKGLWYYFATFFQHEANHQLFENNNFPDYLQPNIQSFLHRQSEFLQLPLLELMDELIAEFGLMKPEKELAYIEGFKEAVYDFVSKNRGDISGFLEWWKTQERKRTVKIPEGHNAMRILTIHKSKGLQFKVILMPFLEWKIFDSGKGNIVWTPYQSQPKDKGTIIPLTLKKDLLTSHFKTTYQEELELAYFDSLNMLYVALTRAEEVLWGFVPYPKKVTDATSNLMSYFVWDLLQNNTSAFQSLQGNFDPENKVFEVGEWPNKSKEETKIVNPYPILWQYINWNDRLDLKKYAVDFSEEGLQQRKKQQFGLLIHELLEKSSSSTEVFQNLEKYYWEGRLVKEEKSMVSDQLNALFQIPTFASWFQEDLRVLVEQPILVPDGVIKRPDRIILTSSEAIVVDFKTGEPSSKHHQQVQEYMVLVKEMTQLPVIGYLCYLENQNIIPVSLSN